MLYALLLLAPGAGLPPPPRAVEARHLAGYEYRVVGPWGGWFRFYPGGCWEHRGERDVMFRGTWELCGGVLCVCEDQHCQGEFQGWYCLVYRCRLAPDRALWYAERRLTGPYRRDDWQPTTEDGILTLNRPRRFKR